MKHNSKQKSVYSVPFERATLPNDGMSRFRQIKPFIGVSQETWRKMVLKGTAPKPIRLGTRCTLYRNEDVHAYLADPLNYKAKV